MTRVALHRTLNSPSIRALWHRPFAGRAVMACASLSILLALGVLVSRYRDEAVLSSAAERIVSSSKAPSDRAIAILHFVYNDQGFLKNRDYFVFPQFGPTPVQVLDEGGDCSDKSRLMVALLRRIGISSTPVMLFDDRMHPTHTVVEAEVESGQMDLDPVYDLYFPKEGGGFYGSAELRKNPQVLPSRLEWMELADFKARYYHLERSNYSHASTFNWRKGWFTRAAEFVLVKVYGDRIYQLHRPEIIEDPKLLIATALGVPGMTILVAVILCTRIAAAATGKPRPGRTDRYLHPEMVEHA